LNVAMALVRDGTLERFGVELIGANARAIQMAEDRAEFAAAMQRIGLATPVGKTVSSLAEAGDEVAETGYPAILPPSVSVGATRRSPSSARSASRPAGATSSSR